MILECAEPNRYRRCFDGSLDFENLRQKITGMWKRLKQR